MRLTFAGILQLLTVSAVFAQANGDIESLGFEHYYRPGCWTPMVIRLTPTSGAAFEGKIAVYQEDADHDHPIFTRPIALRGNSEGGGDKTQRFWMYFIPQPELTRDGSDPLAVNRKLLVYLTTKDGKQLTRLPIRDSITELDEWNSPKTSKLILSVVDQSRPIFSPYTRVQPAPIGVKEPVNSVVIPIGNASSLLPESALGYEAVDAIVWEDADPAQLSKDQRTAIEEYVRRGGRLVVSQTGKPNTWEMVKRGFGPLLPVDVQAIEETADITALKRITDEQVEKGLDSKAKHLPTWKEVGKGPFKIARAVLKPGAVVAETEQKEGAGRPFIVRGELGMGTVTWVAQDLGDFDLTSRASIAGSSGAEEDYKWMYIWDRVFDWGNVSQPSIDAKPNFKERFGDSNNGTYHLTRSFLGGMEFPSRGAAYLGLAILFFIVYWVIAGPGSYLYLAGRKRSGMSWFAFALSALIATALTVSIVKLVLRGAAEIRHVSFVRMTPGEPAVVHSQFGLYIPRDGGQKVELKKTAADAVSYVTAYPSLTTSDEGAPPIDYEVPVFDAKAVTFPYRSTLKKLQAKWVGELPQGVEGSGKLTNDTSRAIEGILTNKTGRDLKHVYFVFRTLVGAGTVADDVLYLPNWSADATVDLGKEFAALPRALTSLSGDLPSRTMLNSSLTLSTGGFERWWYNSLQHDNGFEDRGSIPGNFAMLSLYDRLLPVPNENNGQHASGRYDLHRPALRHLDVSASLAAGKLIVLAQTQPGPLPVPIEVEGDLVTGEGVTYYQFLLPLNRTALNPSTTNPTTQATRSNDDGARKPG